MIIGLTGKNCSGKGTTAKYLEKKGFYYLSLSDIIREELEKKGVPITRKNLILEGNKLRKKFGAGILAKKIREKLEKNKNYVIDSIRAIEEVRELEKEQNFFLWVISAPQKTRFKRMKKRNRQGDPKTFKEFVELEEKELKGKKGKQNLLECQKKAFLEIKNNGSFKELYKKIGLALKKIPQNFSRPGWDTYFMEVAKVVASRSNCVKRKVAAIIVREKRIISTGYNGTPRNTKNCNENGCKRCNSFAESGTKLVECLCSHGEENAIVQAAFHGISVKNATIYSTFSPCLICAKMIINSGIKRVVYNQEYPLNEDAKRLLKEAGIKLKKIKV